jgi:hypothetical protein
VELASFFFFMINSKDYLQILSVNHSIARAPHIQTMNSYLLPLLKIRQMDHGSRRRPTDNTTPLFMIRIQAYQTALKRRKGFNNVVRPLSVLFS